MGVYCDDFGANWPRYNGTALYINEAILRDFLLSDSVWTNMIKGPFNNPSNNMV